MTCQHQKRQYLPIIEDAVKFKCENGCLPEVSYGSFKNLTQLLSMTDARQFFPCSCAINGLPSFTVEEDSNFITLGCEHCPEVKIRLPQIDKAYKAILTTGEFGKILKIVEVKNLCQLSSGDHIKFAADNHEHHALVMKVSLENHTFDICNYIRLPSAVNKKEPHWMDFECKSMSVNFSPYVKIFKIHYLAQDANSRRESLERAANAKGGIIYDFFTNNCEHFVFRLKTNKSISEECAKVWKYEFMRKLTGSGLRYCYVQCKHLKREYLPVNNHQVTFLCLERCFPEPIVWGLDNSLQTLLSMNDASSFFPCLCATFGLPSFTVEEGSNFVTLGCEHCPEVKIRLPKVEKAFNQLLTSGEFGKVLTRVEVRDLCQLSSGDHVIFRNNWRYSHHALVTRVDLGSQQYEVCHVTEDKNNQFVCRLDIYGFQRNDYLKKAYYLPNDANSREVSIANAMKVVGCDIWYKVFTNNCEHFVNRWKISISRSDQADSANKSSVPTIMKSYLQRDDIL